MARPGHNHAARKAKIVATAINSFATNGYEGTTNKTIARMGGFKSPALIYHYFPGGKAELFQACLEQFQPFKTYSQLIQSATNDPPEVHLRRLAHAYFKLMDDDTTAQILRIIITEMPSNPDLAEMLPRHMAPVVALPMISYLNQLAAAGQIKMKQPLAMVLQFFAPLFIRAVIGRMGIEQRLPLPLPTQDELVDIVVDSFLNSLRPEEPAL